jgi:hypothetical protein
VDKQPSVPASADAIPIDPLALWQAWWRFFGPRAPLSGDVSQAIDASLLHAIGDQLGFININTTRSGDPQLEQRITEQVASYGRQLGWIIDALDVLIRNDRPMGLTPDDASALDQLTALRAEIEAAKERTARERVDRVVPDIHTLRQDPEANREELRRLREALRRPLKHI